MNCAVYYRDSDGYVVGSTRSPSEINMEAELLHWGPGISALKVDDDSEPSFKRRRVVSGQLILEDNAEAIAKEKKRKKDQQDGIVKFRQLGLTDDQIKALMRTT